MAIFIGMHSEYLAALILGIVEGLTEFIPVSSTGHLILVGKLLAFEGEKAETFEIFIQLGAILAVVVLYFERFRNLLVFRDAAGFSGVNGLVKLGLACLPACVLGFLLHKSIKGYLFGPMPVAAALIFGGLIMIIVERRLPAVRTTSVEAVTYRNAFLAGVFQCFALWPGMSRSGSMIAGGMILGFSRTLAAEFSFLVAVPMMFLACTYDLYKSREYLSAADIPVFSIGFAVSFITAVLAIRFFLGLLKRTTLVPFGIYRIAVGILVIAAL